MSFRISLGRIEILILNLVQLCRNTLILGGLLLSFLSRTRPAISLRLIIPPLMKHILLGALTDAVWIMKLFLVLLFFFFLSLAVGNWYYSLSRQPLTVPLVLSHRSLPSHIHILINTQLITKFSLSADIWCSPCDLSPLWNTALWTLANGFSQTPTSIFSTQVDTWAPTKFFLPVLRFENFLQSGSWDNWGY